MTIKKKSKLKRSKQGTRKPVISDIHRPAHMTLEEWQLALREQSARTQKLRVRNTGTVSVFSEFAVDNPQTRRQYRVAIRGDLPGVNYCDCPDYSVNTLGTCKHIEAVLMRLRRDKKARVLLKKGFHPSHSELYLRYGAKREVVFSPGTAASPKIRALARGCFNADMVLTETGLSTFDAFLKAARRVEPKLRCYEDALTFIAQWRDAIHRSQVISRQYPDAKGKQHCTLPGIKVPLYSYQYEGAVFAAKAGRAIIADEMGLGKTVQAIAAAELMARHFGVERVLLVCPTSLKYQWKQEIGKFCDRNCVIVEGPAPLRWRAYEPGPFFTIANYEQVFRDLNWIDRQPWDLIILDETQRIKNWKTRTSQAVKSLRSQYALALTGTPLENRLEELHSIISFVDRFRLGPLFKFLDRHQVAEEGTGKVTGYRDLSSIGKTLDSILIRRTKKQVLTQLPERLDKNYFVSMTPQQGAIHEDNRLAVAQVVARWRKYKRLSESDQRRLMISLQNMRMSCDSTYLIDQSVHHGPKIDELAEVLADILQTEGEKAVIFSQWQRMHELVEESLKKNGIGYVFLHGGVDSRKRGDLVTAFRSDPNVRVFLSTDAGGTGLNLQNAATVINMDLPWNPAVLEQRIGRVHRLGQHKTVRVVNFVSEGTIEHGMLDVLAFKKSLFAGVLDGGEDCVSMGESRLNKFMKDVEAVSGKTPALDPQAAGPVSVIGDGGDSANDAGSSSTKHAETVSNTDSNAEALSIMFKQGAELLQNLAQVLANPKESGTTAGSSMIEHDPVTGGRVLKIPIPGPDIMNALMGLLGPLMKSR